MTHINEKDIHSDDGEQQVKVVRTLVEAAFASENPKAAMREMLYEMIFVCADYTTKINRVRSAGSCVGVQVVSIPSPEHSIEAAELWSICKKGTKLADDLFGEG